MTWIWWTDSAAIVKNLCPLPTKIANPAPKKYSQFGAAIVARDGLLAVRDFQTPFPILVYDLKTHDKAFTIAQPGDFLYPNFHGTFAVGNGRLAVAGTDASGTHVFVYEGGALTHTLSSPESSDRFGNGIDIAGNVVVVGAPNSGGGTGRAYLYDLTKAQGQKPVVLENPKPTGPGSDYFGMAVATDGQTVAVGSPNKMVTFASGQSKHQSHAGAVFLFDLSGKPLRTISSPDDVESGGFWNGFGIPITLHSGVLALGSPSASVNGIEEAGAVYVYSATTKDAPRKLVSPTPADRKFFGQSVGIGDAFVVVGSWDRNNIGETKDPTVHASEAALFSLESGEFVCAAKNPPGGGPWNAFAAGDVGADGRTYVVGAWGEVGDGAVASGAKYLYDAQFGDLPLPNAIDSRWPMLPLPIPESVITRKGPLSSRAPLARAPRRRSPRRGR